MIKIQKHKTQILQSIAQSAFFILLFIFMASLNSYSQTEESDIFFSLQHDKSKKGQVEIHQDVRLHRLVDKHISLNKENMSIPGYRIQIYSGSEKRSEAKNVRTSFMKEFPKISTELIYNEPYFKVRVGNFRTKQEGYKLYKRITQIFPNAYFVIENEMEWPEV